MADYLENRYRSGFGHTWRLGGHCRQTDELTSAPHKHPLPPAGESSSAGFFLHSSPPFRAFPAFFVLILYIPHFQLVPSSPAYRFAKRTILHCKTHRFTLQNAPFCVAKLPLLERKTHRFGMQNAPFWKSGFSVYPPFLHFLPSVPPLFMPIWPHFST